MSGVPPAIEVEIHDNDVNVLNLNLLDIQIFWKIPYFENFNHDSRAWLTQFSVH